MANEAWDCDPFFVPVDESEYRGLDEEESKTDWQVIALDRFGDRRVDDRLHSRGEE